MCILVEHHCISGLYNQSKYEYLSHSMLKLILGYMQHYGRVYRDL